MTDLHLLGNEKCGRIMWEVDVPTVEFHVKVSIADATREVWIEDTEIATSFDGSVGPTTISASSNDVCRADYPLGTYDAWLTVYSGVDEMGFPVDAYRTTPIPVTFDYARRATADVEVRTARTRSNGTKVVATLTRNELPRANWWAKLQKRVDGRWRTTRTGGPTNSAGKIVWRLPRSVSATDTLYRVLVPRDAAKFTEATTSKPFRLR
ncbi:hypothetical protein [Nocardioides sp. zg-1228]|uniref:hypothetical protein n=1 Tax=Nocardioides sp. zg-1228 TaxID=2763008 RepID=UPI001643374A|nr:hypothetical protein [Nocardioides sp. zg-1228]MBC2933048.1 hypothetical protein [Nocardioides sp. zg-1228]QSF56758.1 hypothetical protein JX575_14270 [Nocardioides sp. zg-1228]